MQTTFQTPGGIEVQMTADDEKLTIAADGETKNFRTAAIVDGWVGEHETARCLKITFGPLNVGTLYILPSLDAEMAAQAVLKAAA